MSDNNSIIGGEYDIDLGCIRHIKEDICQLKNIYKYSSGRSALYYILLDIKTRFSINTVMLPDYLCSSMVIAAGRADVKILFYPINQKLEIDKPSFLNLYQKNNAVLIINYFGLIDTSKQISFIRGLNDGAIIIEDDVQAYYEFVKGLNGADYKFTSLRKTFAIPDGGLVKSFYNLYEPKEANKFCQYKFAGSVLKSLRELDYYDDDVYLEIFEKGESLINANITTGISNISIDLLLQTDVKKIAQIRQRNAQTIISGLDKLGIEQIISVPENSIPLFIPVYFDDRNKIRMHLFQNNVFCPIHWTLEGIDVMKGREMAEHELSIIVDQRYGIQDMERILDIIKEAI